VTLRSSDGNSKAVPISGDGTFYFSGMEPGSYTIELRSAELIRGRKEVDVMNADLDGVVLAPDPAPPAAFTLSLQYRTDGAGAPYHPPSDSFTFLGRVGTEGGSIARPNPDGTLQFNNLTPGLYQLAAYGVAGDFYVKQILLGGQPIGADHTVDLRHGDPGGIQIVVGHKSASLTGSIRSDAILSEAVTILLIGDRGRIGERATTDQNGRFQMDHVAPGKYSAVAVEGFDAGQWNADVATRLREKSLAIELGEGETKMVELSPVRMPPI
jgi:hypothetical protein